jgi:hypothetical protein
MFVLVAACASKQPAPTTPTTTSTTEAPANEDRSCPLEVPGTSLTVEDTATGAALVFVTTSDPAKVRSRALELASMHQQHNGPSGALGMMFPQEWTVAEHDTATGAHVEFSHSDPAAVQKTLRMHAGHLSSGSCAM